MEEAKKKGKKSRFFEGELRKSGRVYTTAKTASLYCPLPPSPSISPSRYHTSFFFHRLYWGNASLFFLVLRHPFHFPAFVSLFPHITFACTYCSLLSLFFRTISSLEFRFSFPPLNVLRFMCVRVSVYASARVPSLSPLSHCPCPMQLVRAK